MTAASREAARRNLCALETRSYRKGWQEVDRNDLNDQRAVFTLLGELSADVKHILSALDRNQRETEKLRVEFRQETDEIQTRLSKVEKFNVRVLTYASIALPILTVALSWGKELMFQMLM